MVEFVSYDGKFPNLCSGTLTLRINGEKVSIRRCLCSGGSVWFDKDWGDHVEHGAWTLDLPDEYWQYEEQITNVVNENVPYGCCGGCL